MKPAMSALDAIRAALKGQSRPSVEVLTETLASAEQARDMVSAEVQSLQAELEAGRYEPDATRSRLRTQITAATERLEDAVDLVVGIGAQLASARHEADERDCMARALEARAAAQAAADAFAKNWRRVEIAMLDCLEQLYLAEVARDRANTDLPEHTEEISSVEFLARASPGLPSEVISEEAIYLWHKLDHDTPIVDTMQRDIEDLGNGRGIYRKHGGTLHCVRRPYLRRTVKRGTMGVIPSPILPEIVIPSFREPTRHLLAAPRIPVEFFGVGTDRASISMAAAMLEHIRTAKASLTVAPPDQPPRVVETVLIPLDEDEAPPPQIAPIAPARPAEPDEPVDTALLAFNEEDHVDAF